MTSVVRKTLLKGMSVITESRCVVEKNTLIRVYVIHSKTLTFTQGGCLTLDLESWPIWGGEMQAMRPKCAKFAKSLIPYISPLKDASGSRVSYASW